MYSNKADQDAFESNQFLKFTHTLATTRNLNDEM